MDKRYYSRKFILAGVGVVSGIVFFALDKLDPGQFTTYMAWAVGLYMAGNVGDSVAK